MQISVSNVISIDKRTTQVPVQTVLNRFKYPNPGYTKNLQLGLSVFGVSKTLDLAVDTGTDIVMPRGLIREVYGSFKVSGFSDRTITAPCEFSGPSLECREYQQRAVSDMLSKNQGVLVGSTGSGKTAMGVDLIAKRQQRALILVHTHDLLRQWTGSFKKFLGIDCGVIQGEDFNLQPVTIAMMQSMPRPLPDDLKNYFGLVLVDECHRAPCATIREIVDQLPARYRYGVTATPYRADELDFMIHAVLGPVVHQIDVATLYNCGAIIQPKVKVVRTDSYAPAVSSYNALLEHLVNNQDRNSLILNTIKQEAEQGHSCLVLSQRVAHAEHLFEMFRCISNTPARFASGSSSKQDRIEALEDVREGRAQVLFATKIADEGLDLPRLDRLFLTCPARAHGKVTQQMGRITRPFPGKSDAIVFDFLDHFIPMAVSQYRTRKHHAYKGISVEEITWLPLI